MTYRKNPIFFQKIRCYKLGIQTCIKGSEKNHISRCIDVIDNNCQGIYSKGSCLKRALTVYGARCGKIVKYTTPRPHRVPYKVWFQFSQYNFRNVRLVSVLESMGCLFFLFYYVRFDIQFPCS